MNKNLGKAVSIFGSGLRDLATAGGLVGVVSTSPAIMYVSIGFIVLGGILGAAGKAIDVYMTDLPAMEKRIEAVENKI